MYFNKFEKKNKSFSEPIQNILIRVLSTGGGVGKPPKSLVTSHPPNLQVIIVSTAVCKTVIIHQVERLWLSHHGKTATTSLRTCMCVRISFLPKQTSLDRTLLIPNKLIVLINIIISFIIMQNAIEFGQIKSINLHYITEITNVSQMATFTVEDCTSTCPEGHLGKKILVKY